MNTEKCNLQWHTYPDHLTDMLHKLMVSKELTDITLVCDDKKQFKAHKIVLSACSPVFKDIINGLPQNSSVIYLRGIEHQEIESILEFMYLGVATFYQDRMSEFLNVAKNLEIKEISKNSEFNEENDSTQDIPDIENENNLLCEKRQKNTCDDKNEISVSNSLDRTNEIQYEKNMEGMYECDQCEGKFALKGNLKIHLQSQHKGVRYSCNQCDKQYNDRRTLTKHVRSKHEGVKYPCDQ